MILRIIGGAIIAAAIVHPTLARDTYVHSYVRKDGTYVQGYHRTTPNTNPYDNYSTKGNINPWTGQEGAKNPYSGGYHYTGPSFPPPPSDDDNN